MPVESIKIKSAHDQAQSRPPAPPKSPQERRKEFWGKNRWAVVSVIALVFAIVGMIYGIVFFSDLLGSGGKQPDPPPKSIADGTLSTQSQKEDESFLNQIPDSSLFSYLPLLEGRRRFLILLQNSTELRPTGGFIGNIAVVETNDGRLIDYSTADSYSIDSVNASKDANRFPPSPAPMKKYLGQNRFFFRDSNWLPDFRDSSRFISQLYPIASGDTREFDAIIAVNPSVVAESLQILGPIMIEGIEFNQANLVEALEYEVEINAPLYRGKTGAERKEIVNALFREAVGRILNTTKKNKIKIASLAEKKLFQKEIQIYFFDPSLQHTTETFGYAGAFHQTPGDFVAVVDANMAALKTDAVIDRSIEYSLREQDGVLLAKLNITYAHNGYFDWKTGVYKTFTRIYVPSQTHIRSVKTVASLGVLREVQVEERGEYQGKSYIGFYVAVQPKAKGEVMIEYELPASVNEQIRNGTYSLFVQKQSGTFPRLNVRVDLVRQIKKIALGKGDLKDENFTTVVVLESDAEFKLNL